MPCGTVGVTNARTRAVPAATRPTAQLAGAQAERLGVGGVDLDVGVLRVELAEDVRLGRPRLRVPLRGAAAARQELERELAARRLGQRPRLLEEEPGPAVRVVEPAVGEEAAPLGLASAPSAGYGHWMPPASSSIR